MLQFPRSIIWLSVLLICLYQPVQAQLSAGFIADVVEGCAPLEVNFLDQSSGNVTSWQWTFGNGNQSTLQNPSGFYTQPGTYTVTLTVSRGGSPTATETKTAYIHVFAPPEAAFDYSPNEGCTPLLVSASDKSSPGSAPIDSWQWDFGDGSVVQGQPNQSHTYSHPGSFLPLLEVVDTNGCKDVAAAPDTLLVKQSPEFNFQPEFRSYCQLPSTVNFTSTVTSAGNAFSYLWDFGDGQTDTGAHPTHVYQSFGHYAISLTVTDVKNGCSRRVHDPVGVRVRPWAPFVTATPSQKCEPAEIKLEVEMPGGLPAGASYQWRYGDGRSGSGNVSYHTYSAGVYQAQVIIRAPNGCRDTAYSDSIRVWPKPVAAFKVDKRSSCDTPHTVRFTPQSPSAVRWQWVFGDGSSSNLQHPTHTYTRIGIYKVELIVWNQYGCSDTLKREDLIHVHDTLVTIIPTPKMGCKPLWVLFNNRFSFRPIVEWRWNFGDTASPIGPGTSTAMSPSWTYFYPGKYEVTAWVRDSSGCIDSTSIIISVGEPIEPRFSISPNEGCGRMIRTFVQNFTDTTPFHPDSFLWYLPNQLEEADLKIKSFWHDFYGQAGSSNPAVLEVYFNGCKTQDTQYVKLSVPAAEVSYSRNTCRPDSVVFDNNTIGATSHSWDFGDGTTSIAASPTHVFQDTGRYEVVYIAKNDSVGCVDTVIMPILVALLDARFTVSDSMAGCPPLSVTFSSTSKPGMRPITSWKWDFGDGTSSTLQNPQKVFTRPGTFSVKLVVSDGRCADSVSKTELIRIQGPEGSGTVTNNDGCSPLQVTFKAQSVDAASVSWDFGNGVIGHGFSTSYTYTTPGRYIPFMILKDSNGCSTSGPIDDIVWVRKDPVPSFSHSGSCAGAPTTFFNQSTPGEGSLSSATWNFGDGTIQHSSGNDPVQYNYLSPGTYWVSLEVENLYGCVAKDSMEVEISEIDAHINLSQHGACFTDSVPFAADVVSPQPITSYKWNFGNGQTSSLQYPVHHFATPGRYLVTFTVTNQIGCIATDTLMMTISDSLPLQPLELHRVTVESGNEVLIEHPPHPQGGIKSYHYFRQDGSHWEPIGSGIDSFWRDRAVNTFPNSWCYNITASNFCSIESRLEDSNTHCTVNIEADPDTGRSILHWNHYVGWPVKQYQIYRDRVDQLDGYKLVATVPGNIDAWIDSSTICYANHRYRLLASELGGEEMESWSDWDDAQPVYIPFVPAPRLNRVTVEADRWLLLEWEPQPEMKVRNYLLQKRKGEDPFTTIGTVKPAAIAYEDRKVDVHQFSYTYRLKTIDSCGDVSNWSNIGKSILLGTQAERDGSPLLQWTPYEGWTSGVESYEVEQRNLVGEYQLLSASNADTWIDRITNLNSLPEYCYRVQGFQRNSDRKVWSLSNTSCLSLPPVLHVPNAFSPDTNNINETFLVQGLYIWNYKIQIYNRWGELIFESNNLNAPWRGTHAGQPAQEGVYVYIIQFSGADHSTHLRKGTITLLR